MSAINANDAKGSMVQAVGCAMRTMKQGPISDFTGCGAHGAPYEPWSRLRCCYQKHIIYRRGAETQSFLWLSQGRL